MLSHLAAQVDADPASWADYVVSRARLVHQGAIRRDYGYTAFGAGQRHVALLVQLNRQETRHQLARDVFHGRRGHVDQAYRPGQEQQLGALGLVTNILTLWNSGYLNHAVEHLRVQGDTIADDDLERLSPLQHEKVNLHGR